MSYGWTNPYRGQDASPSRPHAFNVHAKFSPTPKRWGQEVTAMREQGANPGPIAGFNTSWPSLAVAQRPCVGTSLPVLPPATEHSCLSSCVEISGKFTGNERALLELTRLFGEMESEPVFMTDKQAVVALYFDSRSAQQLIKYLQNATPSHNMDLSAKLITIESQDGVAVTVPWGAEIPQHDLQHFMTQFGDIAYMETNHSLRSGGVSGVFVFHDRRVASKLHNLQLVCNGVHLTLRVVTFPHSLVCESIMSSRGGSSHSLIDQASRLVAQPLNYQSHLLGTNRHPSVQHESLSLFSDSKNSTHFPLGSHHGARNYAALSSLTDDSTTSSGNNSRGRLLASIESEHLSNMVPESDVFTSVGKGLGDFLPSSHLIGSAYKGRNPTNADYIGPVGSLVDGSTSSHSSLDSFGSTSPAYTPDTPNDPTDSLGKLSFGGRHGSQWKPSGSKNRSSGSKAFPEMKKGDHSQPKDSTTIDLAAIDKKTEKRTTVMVRNIPNKLEFDDFKAFVDQTNKNTYEFLYLRFDFGNRCNVGYAFISFISPEDVRTFVQKRAGMKWKQYNYNSEKVIEIRYARIQGCDNLVEKFRKSSVMHQELAFRPRLYHTSGELAGEEMPFPQAKQ